MRFPRLGQFRRKGKAPAARFGGWGWQFYLGALALLLAGLVAGFYLLFPTGALQQRLEQEIAARAPLEAHIEEVSLLFPLGLQAEGIRLAGGPPPTTFTVTALKLTPLWGTLTGDNPGLAFHAELQGGELDGSLRKHGSIEARLQKLSFSAPLGGEMPLRLSGLLGKGEVAGAYPLQSAGETRLNLSLERVELSGLAPLGLTGDALALGSVSLVGSGRGNALKVERLSASGGSLEITGEGTVMLAEPLVRSRLNLNLVLRPGARLDRSFVELIELFAQPNPDGSFRLRLTGPLAQATIQ